MFTQPASADDSSPTIDESRGSSDRFRLGERIGHGGMGEIRVARDARIGRDVAVKLMRGDVHAASAARFLREARVQGRLDHPAVVPVYDLGTDEAGRPYFAMKRLTGVTLHDVLARQATGDADMLARWPRRLLLARLVEVCLAVEFAHTRGVVHRDLKPANIMLGEYGEVYVLDWGVARIVTAARDSFAILSSDLDSADPVVDATIAGALLGTPGYIPPEQVRGRQVDRRADIYALGCILYEVLTGHAALPRGRAALKATLAATAHHPRLGHPELDIAPELDELCAAATQPSLRYRMTSARELAAGVQRYLDGDRDVTRRRQLVGEYVTAARDAVTQGDRGRAMRAAGRALALDPEDRHAQQLVGHLLLTPPRDTPPEVERALEVAKMRSGRLQMRTAVAVYALFLLAMPLLCWLGVRKPAWIIGLTGAIAANFVAYTYAYRCERPARLLAAGLVLHCGSLAIAGFVLGPLLVLPALAVGSVAGFLSQPMISHRIAVIGAHLASVLVPIAAELAGIVPRTFTLDVHGLHLHPWAVDMSPHALLAVAVIATIMQLVATSVLVLQVRRAKEAAERTTQLQLWHLRQLAPHA